MSQIEEVARTFGVDWVHLFAQSVSFGVVCVVLYRLAYGPILKMLETRRQQIAAGLANAEKIKAQLARIEAERLDILRKADAVYIEEIRRSGQYDDIWQAFAVLLPVKTVGVMGDGRTYDFVIGLRAVTSTDGMTADFYPFDMNFLGAVATRIINEVNGVNRVVYDVTSKPPGTIEWE